MGLGVLNPPHQPTDKVQDTYAVTNCFLSTLLAGMLWPADSHSCHVTLFRILRDLGNFVQGDVPTHLKINITIGGSNVGAPQK